MPNFKMWGRNSEVRLDFKPYFNQAWITAEPVCQDKNSAYVSNFSSGHKGPAQSYSRLELHA
eukprot:1161138-Pelagomonas_calceolata.AAC.2